MLKDDIQTLMKTALRGQDTQTLTLSRLILSAIKDKEIQRGTRDDPLPDADIITLLQAMVKQRQDSIALYEKGDRPDLAAQERAEISLIERFLPTPLSPAELTQALDAALAQTQATSVKDMGKIMAYLKQHYAGRMDMTHVAEELKKRF